MRPARSSATISSVEAMAGFCGAIMLLFRETSIAHFSIPFSTLSAIAGAFPLIGKAHGLPGERIRRS
jgi:hypothetical protein